MYYLILFDFVANYLNLILYIVHFHIVVEVEKYFLDVKVRISDEGYRELMSVQKDFETIDEDLWK